ncbi:hypothetical protein [uncultured Cetobacterium sp.]|nr:hypothetical protein [uncultured Cetobacterium sp.]
MIKSVTKVRKKKKNSSLFNSVISSFIDIFIYINLLFNFNIYIKKGV